MADGIHVLTHGRSNLLVRYGLGFQELAAVAFLGSATGTVNGLAVMKDLAILGGALTPVLAGQEAPSLNRVLFEQKSKLGSA